MTDPRLTAEPRKVCDNCGAVWTGDNPACWCGLWNLAGCLVELGILIFMLGAACGVVIFLALRGSP